MTYGRKEYIDGPRLYPSNADLSQSYGQGAFADFLLIEGSPVDNLDILADKEHMRVMMKAENLQKYKGSSLKMGFVRRSAKARKQAQRYRERGN